MPDEITPQPTDSGNRGLLSPQTDMERMLVLGIQSITNTEFARNISGTLSELAKAELSYKSGTVEIEKIKATTQKDKIELEKERMNLLQMLDLRNRVDMYLRYMLTAGLLFALYFIPNVPPALQDIGLLIIGFMLRDNFSDLMKVISKPKED